MAGLVPAIHALLSNPVDMDARNKSGHDDGIEGRPRADAQTGMPRTSETGQRVPLSRDSRRRSKGHMEPFYGIAFLPLDDKQCHPPGTAWRGTAGHGHHGGRASV